MPIITFEDLNAVPEALRTYAKTEEATGKVTVNVVPEVKLSEFRDKNIELTKSNEDLNAKVTLLSGIVGEDPDAFKADIADMRAVRQRVSDGELREGRQIEEAIAKRTEEMRKGYTDQLTAESREKALWKQKWEQENQKYKEQIVVGAIKDACMDPSLGVIASAIGDITQRAKSVFRVSDDGRLTAYNGEAVIYGGDGTSSITPKDWVGKLKDEADYFFKGSHGGGAGGEGGRGGSSTDKKVAGKYSPEQWAKMDARARLAAANGQDPNAALGF
ncbi:hypothetical protein HOU02_gp122 [Caulobacter phage CcrBL9]|uniref:Phage protein n=1 Tax=Caulobacter phage CcrBL9 TaxID=2283270 RepID=A0A385EBS3_9CAUD|nr:hypothetical protein HOU02_gp122 [Caulobacter phage CcrBL9]AXQ69146.1 hypothetical protein CcrBL9_gp122 [Caulobacter phage CcrBL9]